MRLNPIVIALALGCGVASADPLSDADREALIERLDSLKAQATERLDARFRAGVGAYQAAIGSDDAALALYLQCVEKVDFIDQKKKESEFREWKRKEDEKLSKDSFKLALRHQLNWLSLTLQAASERADREKMAVAAQGAMDNVLRDIEKLKDQQALLKQGVTATVFAKAYEIGNLKLDKWPLSPIDVSQIYEQVILPQYRNPKGIDKLRENWLRRIQQESIMVEHWGGAQKGGGKREDGRIGMLENSRPPELDRFYSETMPTLQWQMELDLFKAGDQAGAALRMINHIEKNLAHQNSKDWSEQFRAMLVAPLPKPAETKAP
ncbi:MAG TPA: hypothetical protein VM511_05255 [Luteolibacter sp.]|nr:hypothetical protein [Luteolibacter sp.]